MPQKNALALVDAVLLRVIIPLWILAGAVFKLIERNPGLLPSQIRKFATDRNHEDWLNPFMRFAIGVEIVAAALMIFVPRVSRAVAIAILSAFCVILFFEIRANATSCGCMGNITLSPWTMILVDGGMLLAAIAFGIALKMQRRPAEPAPKSSSMPGVAIAGVVSVLGVALATAVPERTVTEVTPPIVDHNQQANAPDTNNPGTNNATMQPHPAPPQLPPDTIANPDPVKLPPFYLISNTETWIGQRAVDVDIIKLMRVWPADIETGTRHIIFYSRTCDHCEMMFNDHLTQPLDLPVTAVEIPATRTELHGTNPWRLPMTRCQLLELPIGPDYVMTPPVIVTITNGVVTCASEGTYEECLGVEPTH